MIDPMLYSLVEAVPVRYRQEYIRDLVVAAWNTPATSRVPTRHQSAQKKPVIRVQIHLDSLPPEIQNWINESAKPARRLTMLADFGAQQFLDHPALPGHAAKGPIPVLSDAIPQSWPATAEVKEDVQHGTIPDHISALINEDLDWS